MQPIVRFLCILVLVLAVSPGRAEEAAKLRALLGLVGLETSLGSIPSGIAHSLNDPASPIADESAKQAATRLAQLHFEPSGMLDEVVGSLAGTLTDAQMDELTAFYSDGLGKRVTAMEVAAQSPGMEATVESEGRTLLGRLVQADEERLHAYRRIIEATRSVETGTALGMNMAYAMLSGMMGSPALPLALSDDEILALVNAQSDLIRGQVVESVYLGTAYTYRDMSLADLDAYAAFLETGSAQAFYGGISKAMRATLLSRARAFGHDLMVAMGVRKT